MKKRLDAISDIEQQNALDEMKRQFIDQVEKLRIQLNEALEERRQDIDAGKRIEQELQSRIAHMTSDILRMVAQIDNLESQEGHLSRQDQSIPDALVVQKISKSGLTPQLTDVFMDIVAPSLSPTQSLEVIEKLFPDRVIVLDSAHKSARESDSFRERAKLFELLWKLANDYWQQLSHGIGDVTARAVFGNSFAAGESERASNNKRVVKSRTFFLDSNPIQMFRHLKIGNKDSVYETIRVHFDWLPDKRMIVIGYCGPHLPLT
jgi:hypothetical protein